MDIAQLCLDMNDQGRYILYEDQAPRRARTNHLSAIGDPCLRFLFLDRVAGEHKKRFSAHTLQIFERGRRVEAFAKDLLKNAWGRRIVDLEKIVEIRVGNLSGRIDSGFIEDPEDFRSEIIPIEIKSTTIFDKLNSAEDFLNRKYQRRWLYQIHGYMVATGVEYGVFMLVEPSNFEVKYIPIRMIPSIAEDLIVRGKQIEAAIAAYNEWIEGKPEGTLPVDDCPMPPQCPDARECSDCSLSHICCPELRFEETLKFLNGESELEADIREMEALRPTKNRFDRLDEKNKLSLNTLFDQNPGAEVLNLGNMNASAKLCSRKGYVVEPSSYRRFKFT